MLTGLNQQLVLILEQLLNLLRFEVETALQGEQQEFGRVIGLRDFLNQCDLVRLRLPVLLLLALLLLHLLLPLLALSLE